MIQTRTTRTRCVNNSGLTLRGRELEEAKVLGGYLTVMRSDSCNWFGRMNMIQGFSCYGGDSFMRSWKNHGARVALHKVLNDIRATVWQMTAQII